MTRGQKTVWKGACAAVLLALALSPAAAARAEEPHFRMRPDRPYLGPDGDPLPFASDDEVLEFLRTAEVVDRTRVGKGINNPERLVLEKDGIRARAVWRVVDVEARNKAVGGRYYFLFRDNYLHECAAYLVSRVFDLGMVPPVVPRRIDRSDGTLQLWIEDTVDESLASFRPSHPLEWGRQVSEMHLFDNLVANVDRNAGNLLVDRAENLWLIDHTRAFQVGTFLVAEDRVRWVSRRAWKRLKEVTEEEIQEATHAYLDRARLGGGGRFRAMQKRREEIVRILQERIDAHGEDTVLFDWKVPEAAEPATSR